jgi:hypothetical protein
LISIANELPAYYLFDVIHNFDIAYSVSLCCRDSGTYSLTLIRSLAIITACREANPFKKLPLPRTALIFSNYNHLVFFAIGVFL